jgi:hypothetical protein
MVHKSGESLAPQRALGVGRGYISIRPSHAVAEKVQRIETECGTPPSPHRKKRNDLKMTQRSRAYRVPYPIYFETHFPLHTTNVGRCRTRTSLDHEAVDRPKSNKRRSGSDIVHSYISYEITQKKHRKKGKPSKNRYPRCPLFSLSSRQQAP